MNYATLETRQKQHANRENPRQMIHADTRRLPLLEGESTRQSTVYLFVGIDDYSRELFAAILPDKTQWSATAFLEHV